MTSWRTTQTAGGWTLEFRAWRAFLYTYADARPHARPGTRRRAGLSLNQFEILNRRRAGERGLRMSDLASRVVLSPSGATRAVDQLERKGLVERRVFEGDKRGYLATLTAEGRALLRSDERSRPGSSGASPVPPEPHRARGADRAGGGAGRRGNADATADRFMIDGRPQATEET